MNRFFSLVLIIMIFSLSFMNVYADTEETTTIIEDKKFILCDVNGDHEITAYDARLALLCSADLTKLEERAFKAADYDGDGSVSASDARKILRISADLPPDSEDDLSKKDEPLTKNEKEYVKYNSKVNGFSTNITDKSTFNFLDELSNLLKQYDNLSIYYINSENNNYIAYHENVRYRSQCTIKAPYARYALSQMNNNLSLDSVMELKQSQKYSFGAMSMYPAGSKFTFREIFEYALIESDNTAYKMLFEHFGNTGFNEYSSAIGSQLRLGSYMFGDVSAKEMAKYFVDIYSYKGQYAEFLLECLKKSEFKALIPSGIPHFSVAHKYGYGGGQTAGMHDAAIVFAPHPFVLSIFSTIYFSYDYDYAYPFREAARLIADINDKLFE